MLVGSRNPLLSDYQTGRFLGKGSTGIVVSGTHVKTFEKVALKLIHYSYFSSSPEKQNRIAREIETMRILSHQNVLRLKNVDCDTGYYDNRGQFHRCVLIATELAQNYELYEYIEHTGAFTEILARTLFNSLLRALQHCHSHGVYHRDVKPENLVFNDKFELKLADFGLAAKIDIEPPDQEPYLETHCGTCSYVAPEICLRQKYKGSQADVWSAGVILFMMLTGHPPFNKAQAPGDWWYTAIYENCHDRFWRSHLKSSPQISLESRMIINFILTPDPGRRPTIGEIKQHEWMENEILDTTEMLEVMQSKKYFVEAKKMEENAAKLITAPKTKKLKQCPFS